MTKVEQVDRDAARAREVLAAEYEATKPRSEMAALLRSDAKLEPRGLHASAIRAMLTYATEAIERERERCWGLAIAERDFRRECQAKALKKSEARDFETMAIACSHVATAIRGTEG